METTADKKRPGPKRSDGLGYDDEDLIGIAPKLPRSLFDWMQDHVEKSGASQAYVIRHALHDYLTRHTR
jgi:hypothetical protein